LIMEKITAGKYKLPSFLTADSKDLIKKLLRKIPEARLGYNGAEELKSHPFFRKIDWKALYNRQVEPPIIPDLVRSPLIPLIL